MIQQLVFHIGDFKTGTTALQDWLGAQGAQHGLGVPEIDANALARSLGTPAETDSAFRALARAVERMRTPVCVVSSEHFEHAKPALLAAAIDAHLPRHAEEMRVVAYVRPHGSALLARYGESVKIGNFTGDLAAYLEWAPTRWRLNTHPRFLRWHAAFQNRFALRLYDRTGFAGGSVVRDFAQLLGARDPGEAGGSANPSLGLRDLALLRALHRAIGPLPEGTAAQAAQWALGRDLGERLAQASGLPEADQRLVIGRTLAQRLVKLCAQDAAATDADFFDRPVLGDSLAAVLAQAPDNPQVPDPLDCLTPDAQAAMTLWGHSLRDGLARDADALHRLTGV
jgi:hypothetical protein